MKTLAEINLSKGGHNSFEQGHCAMEAVAWYTDEQHSDHPQCVSPAIAAAMRVYNDRLPDSKRNIILKPLLLEVIGTNTTLDDEITRAKISADYAKQFAELTTADAARAATYAADAARYTADAARYTATYAADAARYTANAAANAASRAARAATYAANGTNYAAIEILIGQHIMDMCKVGR
jgi:hypothetical protein